MQSIKFNYKVMCDEFPEAIEEDSITHVGFCTQKPELIAQELAECYMHNFIYDWEDETHPSDLFDIFVTQKSGKRFEVTFVNNVTYLLDHTVVVELEQERSQAAATQRPVKFSKVENIWIARPFQSWEYWIISGWRKGYTLYFNGGFLANDTRLKHLITAARNHLASFYPQPASIQEGK